MTRRPRSFDCAREGCDTAFEEGAAVAGSYCSTRCRDTATGEKILNAIRHDHRVCSTCFRLRKEIETPTDDYRRRFTDLQNEAIVGYESLTEHAGYGEFGVECVCGAVDGEWDWLRSEFAIEWWLSTAVEYLRGRGRFDYAVEPRQLSDARAGGERSLEHALGRAASTEEDPGDR